MRRYKKQISCLIMVIMIFVSSLFIKSGYTKVNAGKEVSALDYLKVAISYAWDSKDQSNNNGTELYQELHKLAWGESDIYYASCDRSVTTAIKVSGADPNIPPGPCSAIEKYFKETTDKWKFIGSQNAVKYEDLKPGDILINSEYHVMMFAGKDMIKKERSTASEGADTVEGALGLHQSPNCNSATEWAYGQGSYNGYEMNVYRMIKAGNSDDALKEGLSSGNKVADNDSDSKSNKTNNKNNSNSYSLKEEWELGGMPTKHDYDLAYITMTNYNQLSSNEQVQLGLLKTEINNIKESKVNYWGSVVISMVGVFCSLYAVLLVLGFAFDKANTITEFSAVSLLTFGKVQADTTGESRSMQVSGGEMVLSKKKFWGMVFCIFILGIAIMSGWLMIGINQLVQAGTKVFT